MKNREEKPLDSLGSATFFEDNDPRNRLEIAGLTVKLNDKRLCFIAGTALVGEAITPAMRTHRFLELSR